MLLTEGQMSDYKGAALMLPALPKAKELLGDKGYDANWFRKALAERGIRACIPSKSNRKIQIEHDRALYRHRHKIENMFGRLKDWRRIHTRYDRCAHTFMSASLIGRLGSSVFRLSTTPASMSLTGSRFSSESAPRPFQHGIRERSGTIYWTALPATDGRSKRTYDLTSSIVP
jgi:transposase